MNKFMVAYLLVCTVIGLWSPRRWKLGGLIAVSAVGLVLFFFVSPNHL